MAIAIRHRKQTEIPNGIDVPLSGLRLFLLLRISNNPRAVTLRVTY